MDKKTLIIYCAHTINENLIFFCRNGYIDDAKYDYIFIFNNPCLKLEFSIDKPNIKIMTRENIGYDFGGWTHVLFSDDSDNKDRRLYEKYDYFILLNSTVRGPFLPSYYNQKEHGYWPELFISKLNNDVKLVGAIVAFYHSRPFISSAFLVTDRIGLDIGIKNKIFDPEVIEKKKLLIVLKKEMGFSNAIIEAGYNIKSMLSYYKDINLKNYKHPVTICHLNPKQYYGIDVNPYEIIFMKSNRKIDPLMFSKYTEWNINKINNIIKITYGISETEAIDISAKMKQYIEKKYMIDTNININRFIRRLPIKDPYPGKQKKLYIYILDNGTEKIKIINESSSHPMSNVIFL